MTFLRRFSNLPQSFNGRPRSLENRRSIIGSLGGAFVTVAVATVAAASAAPPVGGRGAAEPVFASSQARDAVRDAVVAQLDRMALGIADHEAGRPRGRLLARRFTIETFLMAGLSPQQLAFGATPDVAPLWRHAFDGSPAGLIASNESARRWIPARGQGTGSAAREAITGRFVFSSHRTIGGDDPVVIGGLVLARADRVTLAATWCEPCLAPDAVDFPIMPEGFLLEWDRHTRRVEVLWPKRDRHAEIAPGLDDAPPRLDQPGDLYDLFDGLRPLPWTVAPARETPASSGAAIETSPSGTPPVETGHAPPIWVAHAGGGSVLQRVRIETNAVTGHAICVEQKPVEVVWIASDRYELSGDVLGQQLPTRSVRPRGTITAHPAGIEMRIVAVDPARDAEFHEMPWSFASPTDLRATIESGGRTLATIAWQDLRLLDRPEADRIESSLRDVFEAEDPRLETRNLDAYELVDALDPDAARRRHLRAALRRAIHAGTSKEIQAAVAAHVDELASQDLAPEIGVQSIEALEERLLGRSIDPHVPARLEVAWRAATGRCRDGALRRLLRQRVGQGRFGAAIRLADELIDRGATASELATTASIRRLRTELAAALDDALRPPAPWFEPPGRRVLEQRLLRPLPAEGLGTIAPTDARSAPRSAHGECESLRSTIQTALDEAIAGCGVRPWPGNRRRLEAIIGRRFDSAPGEITDGPTPDRAWQDPVDRRRLGTALRLFLAAHRDRLRAHLGKTVTPRDAEFGPPSAFERVFEECLERVGRLGPASEALQRAGEREENRILAASLDAVDRLSIDHRCSADAARALRAAITAISDARRLRRSTPCFPMLLEPIANEAWWTGPTATLPDAIEAALAADAMLSVLADRIALEDRLIASDRSTATFRTAMRAAQIEALATRIDAVVVETLRRCDNRPDIPGSSDGELPARGLDEDFATVDAVVRTPERSTAEEDQARFDRLVERLLATLTSR